MSSAERRHRHVEMLFITLVPSITGFWWLLAVTCLFQCESVAGQFREPTCGDTRMIGKPGQEAPFDCSQFDMPAGRALSMKHVDVRCKFKNNSVDLPASVCNCCDCLTSTIAPEVAPDLAISVTDALKVEGSLGNAILIGDMLKYSISVSVEACFVEQLRDIVMVHRVPRGIKLENTLQAINVQPKADVCSMDPAGQQLICAWTSITCGEPKRVYITGTATSAGTYKLCATSNTSSDSATNLIPNNDCGKDVIVLGRDPAAPASLGSCCLPNNGGCVSKQISRDACTSSRAAGGLGGTAWYAGRATCPASCRQRRAGSSALQHSVSALPETDPLQPSDPEVAPAAAANPAD